MKTPLSISLSAVLLTLGVGGCQSDESATHSQVSAQSGTATFRALYASWDEAPEGYDLVEAFTELARRGREDASFQLFELTEAEFAELPEGAREQRLTAMLEQTKRQRVLFRAAIDQAVARSQSGDEATARQALMAMERVATVSSRDEQIALGKLLAERFKEWVNEGLSQIEDDG